MAAQYRGRWYYIEQTDEFSKRWFAKIGLLASVQVPNTGGRTHAYESGIQVRLDWCFALD